MNKIKVNYSDLLGKGSYSKVYSGKYRDKYDVAIKIINIENRSDKFLKSIDNEIELIKKIIYEPHPNIVHFYDVIKNDYNVYYVMEICSCGTLREFMKGPIKEQYVQYFFEQLCYGLKYLKNKNIIHRDLKPRNLLLANNNRTLKISDFGFAKSLSSLERCETICGSPLYMAPEILAKTTYNYKSDMWAIGIILFEMLYGYHPLYHCKDVSEIALFSNQTRIRIPPLSAKNKKIFISRECILLLRSLLRIEQDNRITWEDLFNHQWFKNKNNNIISLDQEESQEDATDDLLFKMD
jgi:serine/threonine-protein kinase ULK/ATG1